MVRFIKQEAEEKANEIGISAEEVLLSSCFAIQLINTLSRTCLLP